MVPIFLHRLESFFPAYRAAGGVIDFVSYRRCDCSVSDEAHNHHEAAVSAVKLLTDSINFHWDYIDQQSHAKIPYRWNVNSDAARGFKISWSDFLEDSPQTPEASRAYRAAFFDPPYGMRLSEEEVQKLYDLSLEALNPSKLPEPFIMCWNTEWADFFKPGYEWWGSSLWTITSDHGRSIIVIVATSTD